MALSYLLNQLRRLRRDERGAMAVMMGILAIPLVGFMAVGFEISNWYMLTRSMQNAADAAAVAAALNGGDTYVVEAQDVAARYGFVDGQNNVTVTVTNSAPCAPNPNLPAGAVCYSVAISGYTPLLMAQVVGYQGNANINGALQKQLAASAMATPGTQAAPLCLMALGTIQAQDIRTNGSPTANLNGCNTLSNTAAQCNGHNLGAGTSFAVGANNGCGVQQVKIAQPALDPYAYLAVNNASVLGAAGLSASHCNGNYPQETGKNNKISGGYNPSTPTWNVSAGNNFICGDLRLTGDTTITPPVGQSAVIIIENGQLDLGGHMLTNAVTTDANGNATGVTIVFSGDNSGSYTHAPTDNSNGAAGTLNISAPTSGSWSGVAIYQDPNLTSGLDVYAAGNSPSWLITGIIYMPHASITLKGAIDKSQSGHRCVVLVTDNVLIDGTGGIAKTDMGECAQAGVTEPVATTPSGAQLIL
jgi:hypothetical protein